MQIACKRFGCQKAVEVCYWTCKHRKNCKDWAGALNGVPGLVAITERLEGAAAKSGRIFQANTLLKPTRLKRAAAASALRAPTAKPEPKPLAVALKPPTEAKPQKAKPKPQRRVSNPVNSERKLMTKSPAEEEKTTAQQNEDNTTAKAADRKAAAKPVRPKAPTDGTVYLLLSKNGKYRELREADLLKEAANIIKDSSLRLVKGQYLVPQITFKPFDE